MGHLSLSARRLCSHRATLKLSSYNPSETTFPGPCRCTLPAPTFSGASPQTALKTSRAIFTEPAASVLCYQAAQDCRGHLFLDSHHHVALYDPSTNPDSHPF